jgi:hypothetical protein
MVRDLGRYDAIGVTALAVVALVPSRWSRAPWPAAAALSVAVAVACASEEFLGAYLAPVGLLAAHELARRSPAGTAAMAAIIMGPGAAVAIASLLIRPSDGLIRSSVAAAQVAGVGGFTAPGSDAATQLGATLAEQLALFDHYDPVARIVLPIGLAGFFLALAVVLWALVGRPAPGVCAAAAVWLVLVATALGLVGVDFLRWWSLAVLGFIAVLAVQGPGRSTTSAVLTTPVKVAVGALVVLCVAAQDVPIAPPPL